MIIFFIFYFQARKNTTTFNYFHAEDAYFRNLNYRVHVVINEPLDFSQRSVQDNVSDFVRNLSKLEYLDHSVWKSLKSLILESERA